MTSTACRNRAVKEGRLELTPGGLTKNDLKFNKKGRVVSKAKSSLGKEIYRGTGVCGPKGWNKACQMASEELGQWPVPIQKSSPFYKLARQYFNEICA